MVLSLWDFAAGDKNILGFCKVILAFGFKIEFQEGSKTITVYKSQFHLVRYWSEWLWF